MNLYLSLNYGHPQKLFLLVNILYIFTRRQVILNPDRIFRFRDTQSTNANGANFRI